MESLEVELEMYKNQLHQIESALSLSHSEELVTLRKSIEELIELTKQNLLEKKRQELLALVDEGNDETVSSTDEDEGRRTEDHDDISGMKCQAPFQSKVFTNLAYHNKTFAQRYYKPPRCLYKKVQVCLHIK